MHKPRNHDQALRQETAATRESSACHRLAVGQSPGGCSWCLAGLSPLSSGASVSLAGANARHAPGLVGSLGQHGEAERSWGRK